MSDTVTPPTAKQRPASTTTIEKLLEDSIISRRAFHACRTLGLRTMQDIFNYAEGGNSFIRAKHCGRRTADELIRLARIYSGDRFADAYMNSFDDETCRTIDRIFIELTSACGEAERSVFLALFPTATDFFNALMNHTDSVTSDIVRNITNTTVLSSVLMLLLNVCHGISDAFENGAHPELPVLKQRVRQVEEVIESKFKDVMVLHSLSHDQLRLLANRYRELVNGVPNIVRNFALLTFPDYTAAVAIAETNLDDFVRRCGTKRKSSAGYYNMILVPFRQYIDEISDKPVSADELTAIEFPFLSDRAVEFATRFRATRGYYPVFHILNDYILHHPERNVDIYRMSRGIGNHPDAVRLDDIALRFGLTRERVRQITVRPMFLSRVAKEIEPHIDRQPYNDPDRIAVFPGGGWFEELVETEKVPGVFHYFADLICYYFNFSLVDHFNRLFVVRSGYGELVENILERLEPILASKRHIETRVSTDTILEGAVPADKVDIMRTVLCRVIAPHFGITVEDNDLVLSRNVCNVEYETERIIEQAGAPVHISDIISGIRLNNPYARIKDVTIKYLIQHSDKIVNIGKSSYYTLARWDSASIGSIRDIARRELEASPLPLPVDELIGRIIAAYPWTNEKNVYSNLWLADDFVLLNKTYYGLATKNYPPEFVPTTGSKVYLSFDQRFADFKQFVADNHRMPYQCSDPDESTLARWQWNIATGKIDISPENLAILNEFLAAHRHLPQNGREWVFMRNCNDFRNTVDATNMLPTGALLMTWFDKNRRTYTDYTDNRRRFFADLLADLRSKGFTL